MSKVGIIGLGLIGGSMAKTISSETDDIIFGSDINSEVVDKAIAEGVISDYLTDVNAMLVDILIVALYPDLVVSEIEKIAPSLKKGTVIVDCTGIKTDICSRLSKPLLDKGLFFVGGHPMAGKEVSGYDNADNLMYKRASMILVRDEYTDEKAFEFARSFFLKAGFKSIKESTPEEHDSVIAYTSQMAHVLSSSYIKSPTLDKRYGFSAGSFKDMTRVARLNENMWTDLFLANRESLVHELDTFMENVRAYRNAIDAGDADTLRVLLKEGRELKEEDEQKENS